MCTQAPPKFDVDVYTFYKLYVPPTDPETPKQLPRHGTNITEDYVRWCFDNALTTASPNKEAIKNLILHYK